MARPARLEALEERAMLSVTVGPAGFSGAEVVEIAFSSEVAGEQIPPLAPGSIPFEASMPLSEVRKVAMDLPWRITSLQQFRGAIEADGPGPLRPGPPLGVGLIPFAPEDARDLPDAAQIRIDGSLTPIEQRHFFRLAVGPRNRSVQFSFEPLVPEGVDFVPHRVWISNAEGRVIDSWWFDGSSRRLDVQLRTLFPSRPTVFYIGVEAALSPELRAGPLAYSLEVQREAPRTTSQFPTFDWPFSDAFIPVVGNENWPEFDTSSPPQFRLKSPAQGLGPGPGEVRSMLDASSSDRLTRGEVGVNVVTPLGVGRGLVRPLPIQSASAVGGLLPAGPAVRGDGESADRAPGRDDFDHDERVAVEMIHRDGLIPEGRSAAETVWSGPDELVEALDSGHVPASNPTSLAISRPGGPGAFPSLAEGLRVAWGRPPILPTRDLSAEADALSSLEIPSDEVDPVTSEATDSTPPAEDPDSEIDLTRPRVLRTALIGVAALAVGLLLPDLTAERPLLLQRRAWPNGPRRVRRARVC